MYLCIIAMMLIHWRWWEMLKIWTMCGRTHVVCSVCMHSLGERVLQCITFAPSGLQCSPFFGVGIRCITPRFWGKRDTVHKANDLVLFFKKGERRAPVFRAEERKGVHIHALVYKTEKRKKHEKWWDLSSLWNSLINCESDIQEEKHKKSIFM